MSVNDAGLTPHNSAMTLTELEYIVAVAVAVAVARNFFWQGRQSLPRLATRPERGDQETLKRSCSSICLTASPVKSR
jgi:hypothetical protein